MIDEESDRLNRFIGGLAAPERTSRRSRFTCGRSTSSDVVRAGLHRAETVTRDHRVVVASTTGCRRSSVDAASITEVIYILLDNASKYAPAGTTITLAAAR